MHGIHTEGLDLNLLGVLDAMYREGNVTRAAAALGLTQSATSHALNRAREFFGDQLFVKAAGGMVPTRKAEALQVAVVGIMASVRQEVVVGSRFEPKTSQRRFTMCMADLGELVFIPPLLERFRRDAPGCSIRSRQVPFEQIEALLGSGEADLALGSNRTTPEGLYQEQLFVHSLVTVVSTRNKTIGAKLTLEEFEQMPHVIVSLRGRSVEGYDQILDGMGIKRKVVVMTPHFLMIPILLEQQPDLIATVPLELANVFGRLGLLRMYEPPIALPKFGLHQHWHPRFHNDPAVLWLRGMVKRTFANYPQLNLGA